MLTPATRERTSKGQTGPAGPAGIVRNDHGADAHAPRIPGVVNLWVGSVDPVNADHATDLIVWTG